MKMMIGSCPSSGRHEAREKCERPDGGADFVTVYPVTSADTEHAYKNAYCAWCHGERRVLYWKPVFRCHDRDRSVAQVRLEDASDQTLLYNRGRWYYADYENRTLLPCDFELQPPVTAVHRRPVPPLRPCTATTAALVDGCPAGTPTPLAQACVSHTYTMYEGTRTFRNPDCARCNNVTVDRLSCVPPPPPLRASISFSSLFAVRANSKHHRPCAVDELYDVPAAKCRNVIHEQLTRERGGGDGACRTSVAYGPGEYDGRTLDNGTAYVYAYRKRIRYRRGPNGTASLVVCTDDVDLRPQVLPEYTVYLDLVGAISSFVSVVSLIAHLALFVVGLEPKNLPEKNLASLATSLLLGYTSFLAVLTAVPKGPGLPCPLAALTMQFGFLSAFAWMFVISIDVWIVLYASQKKLRVAGGKRNGRFAVYSAFAWLAPAALTAFTAALQWSVVDGWHQLHPNFQHICWFRNPHSLIALFVVPAGTTIIANYVSFFSAVRLIVTSGDGIRSAANSTVNRTRQNLKIYVRLSLMMGLAWASGLVAAIVDSDVIWTLHTALNSLHGLFIFLAFDCNWNTMHNFVFRKNPSNSETQNTAATPLSGSI